MIDPNFATLSVRQQCLLLNVNRSNLYYQPRPNHTDTDVANDIHEIWMEMPFYGYRRLTAELQRRGYDINHKRLSKNSF
jgi:putative transposase